MKPLIASLAVLALITAVAFAVRYSLCKERAFLEAWRAFAARRGLRWFEPSGRWYRRGNPRMEGEHEGVALALERYVVSNGKTSVPYTRARVELPEAVQERVITCRRSWIDRMSTAFRGPLVDTGDREYDARMLVRCRSPRDAGEVLDATVRQRILAAPRRLYVECQGREAKVSWRGSEADPGALEAGMGVAAALQRSAARV